MVREGRSEYLCSVPLNEDTTRRLIGTPGHQPTMKEIRTLLLSVDTVSRPLRLAQTTGHEHGAAHNVFLDPVRIVKFLVASRHYRSQARAQDAQHDTIDAAFDTIPEVPCLRAPSKTFLCDNRARFDSVMMLMQRHQLRKRSRDMASDPCWFYMCDSSPASGFESFAVIENLVEADKRSSVYRQAPCTFPAVGQLGVRQKLLSLLWAIYLKVGPTTHCFGGS